MAKLSQSYVHGGSTTPLIGDTIGDHFLKTVARWGDRDALIVRHQDIRYTYAQLGEKVEAFAKALEHVKVVGVMDRADSFGAQGGPVFLEIRAALYDSDPRPQVLPFIYGLGGRDIVPDNIEQAFAVLREAAQSKKRTSTERRYLNLRED